MSIMGILSYEMVIIRNPKTTKKQQFLGQKFY